MARSTFEQQQQRRRAGLGLSALAVLALIGLALLTVLIASRVTTSESTSTPAPPPMGPAPEEGDWDLAAEHMLATAPMVALPAESALPQPMSTRDAGTPISLPASADTRRQWIPNGFPSTSNGALGQLAALDEAALRGGDPGTYARGYRELALPGSPAVENTGLYSLLRSMRDSAGLAQTGPVPDLTVHYQPTHGQIKGTADGGRYVVACVLGQLSVDYQGQTITAGVGDCQALRRVDGDWRISPGPMAAAAPSAWPGSDDAVRAGYRDLKRGG